MTSFTSPSEYRRVLSRAVCALAFVRRARVLVTVAMVSLTQSAGAQTPIAANCLQLPQTVFGQPPYDVCQKVVDIFAFMSPQIGVALAGGNPILGEGGTLGGWGKISGSLRLTAVDGTVPKNSLHSGPAGGPISSEFGATRVPVPLPAVDGALGVFKGLTVGLTNVGGVDLLVGATYVPNINKPPFSIRTVEHGYAFSYGVRIGVLQESAAVPGVSFSYKQRKLPTAEFLYTPNTDTLTANNVSVTSKSMRLVLAKHLGFVGFAAGIGRDDLRAKSDFRVVLNNQGASYLVTNFPAMEQKVTRNNAFGNLSFGLATAQLVLEYGFSSAGTIQKTINTFGSHQANEGYHYASLGFGFRL